MNLRTAAGIVIIVVIPVTAFALPAVGGLLQSDGCRGLLVDREAPAFQLLDARIRLIYATGFAAEELSADLYQLRKLSASQTANS